jgi:hypothetical protein
MEDTYKRAFVMPCPTCTRSKRKPVSHIMVMGKCPRCGIYEIPVPKSDIVADRCGRIDACDGCEAYEDHLR